MPRPTTLDALVAGLRPPIPILKVGTAAEAAGVWHSHWYAPGVPGAGAAPSSGVNGGSHSSPLAGQILRDAPAGGLDAYLANLRLGATVQGVLLLCDRLWTNSGLSVTSTSAQAITPAALPARSEDATANGKGVLAAVEWSAAGGAGTPTVTLTYTDQDGNTGATGTLVGNATPVAGAFEVFGLAAGDTGVRAPTSFIQSATRTSGTMHLVLFRILASLSIGQANVADKLDVFSGGMPELIDGTVPFLVQIPSATTATSISGVMQEAHT